MKTDIERWLIEEGEIFLKDIGIKRGQSILDFGCGAGHYTIPAAKVAGEEGKVYALDKDREVLNQLMQTAESEGLKNIVPIVVQSEELEINLGQKFVDAMLLYDVLHYMKLEDRKRIYKFAHRVLKIGAILSVYPKHCKSDESLWNLSDMELEDIIKEIEDAKFNFEGKFYKKILHDNSYNMGYVLNFTKNKEQGGL